MITRKTSSSVVLVLTLVMLLMAARAAGTDAPLECTTDGGGNWTVHAVGPLSVTCPDGRQDCTEVSYEIFSNFGLMPDHVVTLADHDVVVIVPEARNVYPPCQGDSMTPLGHHDCSAQTVRLNRNDDTGAFDIVVEENKDVSTSSILIKKGRTIEACRIAGLGKDTFDPNAQRTTAQQLTFKGCTVTIPTNPVNGEGEIATISGDNCVFVANAEPVSAGELLVNGQSVGVLTFGSGEISSGTSSCTTKVVNRRLYTWCTCADVDGDGIPDDPIPPCPETVP